MPKIILIFALLLFQASGAIAAESMTCQYGNGSNSRQCLLCNCFFETQLEPLAGKLAVANTVLARVHSKEFPRRGAASTVCNVIYDPAQFSWTKSKKTVRKIALETSGEAGQKKFKECVDVTDAALKFPPTEGPLYYHADYVKPAWAKKLTKVQTIGAHIFYTDPKNPAPKFDNPKVKSYLASLQAGKPATTNSAGARKTSAKKRAVQ